ncbi:MAG: APC family permease [Gemmataceae bacterium]|nr:APC family permease [Gemmataceae bacterium]
MIQPQAPRAVPATLGLWDTISLIVGIIVGVGIFKVPGDVLASVSSPWESMAAWVLGGILSVIGALCFAELASAFPRSGGDYVYLTRAFGPGLGFLSGWAQLSVVRTGGGIAALAYVFADSARDLGGFSGYTVIPIAVLVIVVLTLVNILGAAPGVWTQNWLTIAKLVGLAALVLAGFFWSNPQPAPATEPAVRTGTFAVAMIFILFAYDGWNEAAYVAGEVRGWRRTMPLALILGTSAVMVIYLVVNAAYIYGLGFDAARAPAARIGDLLALALGENGARAVSVLIMVSVLSAANGTIFAGARLYAEMGSDHAIFAPLGRWSRRWGTPIGALVVQALICIGMVVGVGWWGKGQEGFETLVTCTAPVFWLFFLLTGVSLFVLRFKEPHIERPFLVPIYPVTPLIFCGCCAYMLYGSVDYAKGAGLIGLAIVLAGLPLYVVSRRLTGNGPPAMRSPAKCASRRGGEEKRLAV